VDVKTNRSALFGIAFAATAMLVVLLLPVRAQAQFRWPSPYPFGGYRGGPESDLRIKVTPKEAAVYVDGYHAGWVDEFDGAFQRLHVLPGEHEITIYLEGYRTIRERLYLSPRATRTIERTMERLGPGEAIEPVPQPIEPPASASTPPGRSPMPRRGRAASPPPPPPPAPVAPSRDPSAVSSRVGTLVVRVQPADAEVFVDGERWRGPSGSERLVIQVPDGRHRIEVRKQGYQDFSTELEVRAGESAPLNVSLVRGRD
jgi:hypothetical protein